MSFSDLRGINFGESVVPCVSQIFPTHPAHLHGFLRPGTASTQGGFDGRLEAEPQNRLKLKPQLP